jgi:tRNA threonylcarbamoyladenosine biosynthesis protein TsaB
VTLLGLDTSTPAASACVLRADGEAFEVRPPAERLERPPAHASELMPAVAEAMERAGIGWNDLDAIAVGVGPGTFTGLRIGIATARALATAAGLPLRRVSSLAALAAGIGGDGAAAARSATGGPLRLPLIDARRGEVFAALFAGDRELWPPFAASPEDLVARLREGGFAPLAAGDGSLRFRGMLEEAGIPVEPQDSAAHVVRALHICCLGEGAHDESPEAVLPEYLREPDAKPQR